MITQTQFDDLKNWCAIVRERTSQPVKLALIGNFEQQVPIVKVGCETITGFDSEQVISQLAQYLK